MIQLLLLLAISWGVLWLFKRKNVTVLGLEPTGSRLFYAGVFFMLSAACAALAFLLRMYIAKEEYVLSPSVNASSVFTELLHQFRTVLTEELLCRGALLYILITYLGNKKAIVISSVVFAVLHWLNTGVWGNGMQMTYVFVFTFTMGLLLAYAYSKTYSLLIPFSIHFGWNLIQNYVFPDSAYGNHVFVLAAPPPTVTVSHFAFFTMLLLPKVLILVLSYWILRKHQQVEMP